MSSLSGASAPPSSAAARAEGGARRAARQDTYLLATQQEATLAAELGAARAKFGATKFDAAGAQEHGSEAGADGIDAPLMDRRRLFCHRSPTDNFLISLGRWIDAAVPHAPNRYRLLVDADAAGARLTSYPRA